MKVFVRLDNTIHDYCDLTVVMDPEEWRHREDFDDALLHMRLELQKAACMTSFEPATETTLHLYKAIVHNIEQHWVQTKRVYPDFAVKLLWYPKEQNRILERRAEWRKAKDDY